MGINNFLGGMMDAIADVNENVTLEADGVQTLAAMISRLGSTNATIYIKPGTHSVSSDLTIPANITLFFENGAILSVADTKTLTLNCDIIAGRYKIFELNTSGALAGSPKNDAFFVEWWGAVAQDSETGAVDTALVLEEAYTFIKTIGGGTLSFGSGTYWFDTQADATNQNDLHIKIVGEKRTILQKTSTFSGQAILQFYVTNYIEIEGLYFVGITTDPVNSASGDDGFLCSGCTNIEVRNCYFKDLGDSAIRIRGLSTTLYQTSNTIIVDGNVFENCGQTSCTQYGSEYYIFTNNIMKSKGQLKFAGLVQGQGKMIIANNIVEQSYGDGIMIEGSCYFDIHDNIITNVKNVGIRLSYNTNGTAVNAYADKSCLCHHNIIKYCPTGIVLDNGDMATGDEDPTRAVSITDNDISYCTGTPDVSYNAGIYAFGNRFHGLNISGNKITHVKQYGIVVRFYAKVDPYYQKAYCFVGSTNTGFNYIKVEAKSTGSYAGHLANGKTCTITIGSPLAITQSSGDISITAPEGTTLNDLISSFNAEATVNSDFLMELAGGGVGTGSVVASSDTFEEGFTHTSDQININYNDIYGQMDVSTKLVGIFVSRIVTSAVRKGRDINVIGNMVDGFTKSDSLGIHLYYIEHARVEGNTSKSGCVLEYCDYVSVRGNKFKTDTATSGLYVYTACSNVQVENNIFDCSGDTSLLYADGLTNIVEANNIFIAGTINRSQTVPVVIDYSRAYSPTYKFELFDDFLYQTITEADTPWILNKGSDTEALDPAITAAECGVIRLTTGDVDGAVANDGSQIIASIPVQADSGGLMLECRLKIVSAVTNISVNVGFTDTTSLEEPFTIGGSDAITSVATDAVCFVYDTGADTDQWFACAVDSNTDDTGNATTAVAPTAGTYQKLKICVSPNGNYCTFYIDDVHVKTLSNAGVTPTVNLYATVIACATTTTSKNVDVDYIRVTHIR